MIVPTRSGFRARILATDLKGALPILAVIEVSDKIEVAVQTTATGHRWGKGVEDPNDLLLPKPLAEISPDQLSK